jgi:hypothetical protein
MLEHVIFLEKIGFIERLVNFTDTGMHLYAGMFS